MSDAPVFVVRLDVPPESASERIDRFVTERMPDTSRSYVQRLIESGDVLVNGEPTRPSYKIGAGDRIEVRSPRPEAPAEITPAIIPIPIVFEDDDVMVFDKPAGLVVHPAAGNWRGTLMNGLLHHRPALARLPRAGIVHRLDRDTSGLLVVAKSERAFASLTKQLAERSMGRRYLALAVGVCRSSGTIDAPIGRDPVSRVRMAVVAAERGKAARTHYERLALGTLEGRDLSLLECRLESGRTHQIRVHLRSIGHPLVGDTLYGGPALGGFARQALHAWRLALRHPADGRPMQWRSPLPDDLRALCAVAGIDVAPIEARE